MVTFIQERTLTTRREFLARLSAGAAGLTLVGCGTFPAEEGAAYAPWQFPEPGAPPALLAVHAALLAASPHNTQPWSFAVQGGTIDVHAALARNLGTMDGLRRELWLGLGCAVENLVLAAGRHGRQAVVTWLPTPGTPEHAARIVLFPAEATRSPLYDAIARRHTNRGAYADGAVLPGLQDALQAQVVDPAVSLVLLTSAADRARFMASTVAATEAILADDAMLHDSDAWYRHTRQEIDTFRDGPTLDATGLGAAVRALGKTQARPTAAEAGQYWLDGTRGRQATSSAIGILTTAARSDRTQQLSCGRTYQRLHLWATSQGLAMQPLNQLPERQDRESVLDLEPRFSRELAALAGQEASTVQLAFRLGVPWDEALQSPRRPLAWVLR